MLVEKCNRMNGENANEKLDSNMLNIKPTDHMNIVLTYLCNRACPGCISSAHKNKRIEELFLSLENVERVIDFAHKNNVISVALTGGEPTLHPHISEVAKRLHDSGLKVYLYTNFDFQERVKSLDGVVDYIYVSYYGQEMPRQKDFSSSRIMITTLLYKEHFQKIEDLDAFIEKYQGQAELVFACPVPVNNYAEEQTVDFLEKFVTPISLLPDGQQVQEYRGFMVRRPDLGNAYYVDEAITWKVLPDGSISHFYSEATAKLASSIHDSELRVKVLSTHNPKQRKKILENWNSSK